jgi:transcriptional regulator with XRE-family HTH domain
VSLPEPDRSYQAAVGRRLQHHRTAMGLSRPMIARCLGITPQTLGAWETGARNMGTDDLAQLAGVYGVAVERFLPERWGAVA